MARKILDAHVREAIRDCGSRYVRQQNTLNTRELEARNKLSTISQSLDTYAKQIAAQNVPAQFHQNDRSAWIDIGEKPNVAGRISVKTTSDFHLVVTGRRARLDGDDETQDDQPRLPSELDSERWAKEFHELLLWIFEKLPSPEDARGSHDDDDDDFDAAADDDY